MVMAGRWALGGARAFDGAVVVGLLAADVSAQAAVGAGAHLRCPPIGAAPVVVAAGCAAVLWWRRTRPITALVGTIVSAVLAGALVPPGLWTQHVGLPVLLATYAVASWSERRLPALLVPALVGVALSGGVAAKASLGSAFLAPLAVIALPWIAGVAARSRRRYLDEVKQRLAEAEREQDLRAQRAVLEERRHIARELHDVVAHHVSLIGVQAGAARTALAQSPDRTRDALLAIEESSRSAVLEMRHLLGVLRGDGAPEASLEPPPSLSRLDELVASYRRAGLDVQVRVGEGVARLSPLADLCCYRVIEEGLTNVATHSAARHACVDVVISSSGARVVVQDPGPARPGTAGSGRGLAGLRERVAMFGGWLDAGPTSDGGFVLDAGLTSPQE